MITLRHHVLTIVAVFLALAAGIVLGGGPLSDVGPAVTSASQQRESAPAATARAPTTRGLPDGPCRPDPGRAASADRPVVVVTVPGADEHGRHRPVGGAGRVRRRSDHRALRPGRDLVDPAQKSLVDTGSQLLTQQPAGAVAADASTYDRIGQLIGLAVATKEDDGEDVNRRSRAIADAVSGAGLMKQPDDVTRRAPLVLLVLGDDAGDEGSDAILAGLAGGLAAQATGVVVAGTLADGGSGQLGRFRADPVAASVASLDGVDTSAGRVAAVMLLQRSLTTPGGSFGASGADGAVPLG
ncbi:copper transporter [Rhodoblastus acidophilus]|nr:copper transporter [Rhodoblastus acidophilus]